MCFLRGNFLPLIFSFFNALILKSAFQPQRVLPMYFFSYVVGLKSGDKLSNSGSGI